MSAGSAWSWRGFPAIACSSASRVIFFGNFLRLLDRYRRFQTYFLAAMLLACSAVEACDVLRLPGTAPQPSPS